MGPLFLLPSLIKQRKLFQYSHVLVLRTIFGISAMTCLYAGFKYGNPGQVSLIFNCSILWTCIISRLLIKERLEGPVLGAIAASFVGLFLILNPFQNPINSGTLYAFLGSILNTGVIFSLKACREKHSSIEILAFFHFCALFLYCFHFQIYH